MSLIKKEEVEVLGPELAEPSWGGGGCGGDGCKLGGGGGGCGPRWRWCGGGGRLSATPRCGSGCSMLTEMGDEGAVPTVSISEQGDGVAWLLKSAGRPSPWGRKSPFMTPGLPVLPPDRIVSIPKLDPLGPSMADG